MFKRLISIILITLIVFSLFATIAFADNNTVRIVKVGFFGFDGYHEYDENGNRSGYGYEYLQQIAKTTGWKYSYVDGTLEECLQMLENGEIDLLTSTQYTAQRAEKFDFSSNSMGTSYAQLTVKKTNTVYERNNFAGFDGMVIGLLKSNSRNERLAEFAEENNFKYTTRYYTTSESLEKALEDNKVDAILTSSLRKLHNEKVIAQFSPSPFYAMVKKGNTQLLKQINTALSDIEISSPNYKNYLYNKYYLSNTNLGLALSDAEKRYLEDKKVLRVVANPASKPISYFEKGELKGIARDIFDLITQDLGIKTEYIQTDNYQQAVEMVKNGEADILCAAIGDYNWAEKNDIRITSSYMDLSYSAITQKNPDTDTKKIATNSNSILEKNYILPKFKQDNVEVITCQTVEQAVELVSNGDVRVAIINTYSAAQILEEKYPHLKATYVNDFSGELVMALGANSNQVLYNIIDSRINAIDLQKVLQIATQHTRFQNYRFDFISNARRYPEITIISCITGLIIIMLAISGITILRKRHTQKVFDLAYWDKVTGLWNINGLEEQAKMLIQKYSDKRFVVAAIDLLNFSSTNNNYGRDVGNLVILQMADVLKRVVSETTIVAHGKADHFVLFFEFESEQKTNTFLDSLVIAFSCFDISDFTIKFKSNAGVYIIEDMQRDKVLDYIDRAETAHRFAKIRDNSKVVYYDEAIKEIVEQERDIINYSQTAMENKEFEIYIQPKYNMCENTIIGGEALIRWNHPENGLLSPAQFVEVFEKSGFIVELDFFVLEEICKMISARIKDGKIPIPISVNQSRAHFNKEGYTEKLKDLLDTYQIPPNAIELEITESLFDIVPLEQIKQIKQLGYNVSVDDFGTGYSSLYLLSDITADVLKIDKSFLINSETSEKTRIVLRKLIEMATELGLDVICEGVETYAQVNILISIGCVNAQGYLYSRPMPKIEFEKLIEKI